MDVGIEARGVEPKLTDVLLKMNDTLERLQQTVEKLSKTEDHDKSEPDNLEAKIAGKEEGWETVRDTLQNENGETIDSWKDELNNLLIFAGLFSAVVTAFTVESYSWLQQDPGDASNLYLAHMSMQFASFTIGSGFVNSSTPALPLQNVTSSFTPADIAVPVNTLWVLSLTLSLISAFFAIAVQQWLRQLRLPGETPVRRAVQLLAIRSDGLKTWQVSGIISLLPLLLQIAVVLFLVGLFLLLRSLNTTVAVAFGAVAVIGLGAFLITVLVPLITIRCPYKSPIVPTILIVLQCLSYPLAFATTAVVLPLSVMFVYVANIYPGGRRWTVFHSIKQWCDELLVAYVKSFGRHMFVDMAQFWLLREFRHIYHLDDESITALESSSLSHSLLLTRSQSSFKITQCLHGFDAWRLHNILERTVVQSLSAIVPGIGWNDVVDMWQSAVQPEMVPYVRNWLSIRHHRLCWWLLRRRDWAQDGEVSKNDGQALLLFYELDKAVSGTPRQLFVKHLLHVCECQRISKYPWSCEAIPVSLVFNAITDGYTLDKDDVRVLVNFTYKCFSSNREHGWPIHPNPIGLCLISSTSALTAMCLHPSIACTEGLKIVDNLAEFLGNNETKDILKSTLREYYGNPDKTLQYESIPPVLGDLCETLVKLADSRAILQSPQCPSIHLTEALRYACAGLDWCDMLKAQKHLNKFNQMIPDWDLGWRVRELLCQRLDGYLDALVLAEGFRAEWSSAAEDDTKEIVVASATRFLDSNYPLQACDSSSGPSDDGQANQQNGPAAALSHGNTSAGSTCKADDTIVVSQAVVDSAPLETDAAGDEHCANVGAAQSRSGEDDHDVDSGAASIRELELEDEISAQTDEAVDVVPSSLDHADSSDDLSAGPSNPEA